MRYRDVTYCDAVITTTCELCLVTMRSVRNSLYNSHVGLALRLRLRLQLHAIANMAIYGMRYEYEYHTRYVGSYEPTDQLESEGVGIPPPRHRFTVTQFSAATAWHDVALATGRLAWQFGNMDIDDRLQIL